LVPNSRIRANPVMTSVPYADAVVVAPFGSHPYASHGFYAEDAEHIEAYVRATAGFRKGDRSGLDAYLDKYVFGPQSHDDYLDLVGGRALRALEAEYEHLTLGRHAFDVFGADG
jgi:glutaconate CoA-transferase subunit A